MRTDSNLNRQIVGSIDLGVGVVPYVHDFSLTETGLCVLSIWPLFMDAAKVRYQYKLFAFLFMSIFIVTGCKWLRIHASVGMETRTELHALCV